jgi:hypothetical protein
MAVIETEKALISLHFVSESRIGQTRCVTAGQVMGEKIFKPIYSSCGEQDNAHCEDLFPFEVKEVSDTSD